MTAAQEGKLCIVGFGNSAADICTAILRYCGPRNGSAAVHVTVRIVPPVFPSRRHGLLRIDTIGSTVRWMPSMMQEAAIRLLLWCGAYQAVRYVMQPFRYTCQDCPR